MRKSSEHRRRVRALACLLVPIAVRAQQAITPAGPVTTVTVTADRGLVDPAVTTSSVMTLEAAQLQNAPGLSLDDKLRQAVGFQLFRRTSSWTANPTTEGVSLRGLGSTAASRTLVVSDQVPQNDPFGGWIHWDEVPLLAIANVNLLRGGSADLYGSSAIGGVIDIVPVKPVAEKTVHVAADVLGAAQDSAQGDALVSLVGRDGAALGAFSGFGSGGYVATAPDERGAVDVASGSGGESARVELHAKPMRWMSDSFLRGNVLDEARGNGTPLQTNATRLWRYAGGADAAAGAATGAVRVFGSRESYRQSFSAIAADRNSERLTKQQRVPTDEFGFAVQGAKGIGARATAAIGLDLRDVRATDDETAVAGGVEGVTVSTSARQRALGGFANGLWTPGKWAVNGSIRVDSFRTFAAGQTFSDGAAAAALPTLSELVASPHLGVLRKFGERSLYANAFRAFRGPTMNELYRTGQVGSQTTLANPGLLAERATGFEFGGNVTLRLATVHAGYFWTEVNRPVSAVLLTQTATAQTLQRQNLGQIRSRGLELQASTVPRGGFDGSVGYQLAVATVTAFNTDSAAQADLTGKWIPQVPRESVIVTANEVWGRNSLHAMVNYTGQQFDDAANQFVLHPFARFDVSAERRLGRGVEMFVQVQNLLDRAIDAGRTPLLTLAAPRLVEAGMRWRR